jgi:hypothetical protein
LLYNLLNQKDIIANPEVADFEVATMATNYLKPEQLTLKSHAELSERWVQDRIAEDPAILGLGDLVLRGKERIQPRAGAP